MRVGLLTREYPPDVYGGAGVHVDFLARHLRRLVDLDVYCMGDDRPGATAFAERDPRFPTANSALQILSTDLAMAAACQGSDLVHSHTWYANMAGHVSALLYGIPHVVSAHSLEPQRPWKAEQLGGGYRLSSWAERTAYEAAAAVIAVSEGMARDITGAYPAVDPGRVHVIYNGIDAEFYRYDPDTSVVEALGMDLSRPYVTFVGRITRQKGVPHLLRAGLAFDPAVQILLLAGAADTPELKAETDAAIEALQASRDGVVVVSEMLPRESVRQVLSHALAFLCPSVYEPLGIVNLEAMACETAVVASAVGGIPEVVVDKETGLLVQYDADDPAGFERDLAARVNDLVGDPELARRMGRAGRERAIMRFDWSQIAAQTADLYRSLL
jgi:alpha-maltose-1-phosphate synthase